VFIGLCIFDVCRAILHCKIGTAAARCCHTARVANGSDALPLNNRPRWALPFVLSLLFSALLLPGCAALDSKQRQWIFQPSDRAWSGGVAAAEGMQDIWIPFQSKETGQAARLHGLWLPQAKADAPVLLYLHGARWDVRGSAPRMRRLHELGFAVLGVDYRGFGKSEGAELPSEAMAYEDASAAWQWLTRQHPNTKRYVFGHSLGGAIAVDLASQADGVAGLMVEGSFPSVPELVNSYRFGWLPVGPLITQRFEAGSRIAKVRAPVLVVHGSEDQTVPLPMGRALFEQAREPKRFVLVQGGGHHNTNAVGLEQYRVAVQEMFGLAGR
jgi:uncharacterized protein